MPSHQTLTNELKPASRSSTSRDFIGDVIPENIETFVKFELEARRVETIVAVHASVMAATAVLKQQRRRASPRNRDQEWGPFPAPIISRDK